ncbi:PREDICTED: uncharacterized protein LOC107073390 [Polistes dominula]|uniref:Uncharacterized protein LOC107073390 n=1 Tax=Polistes dominula TaxID=743375 RepID=A0ABM1JAL6_POLDO|nr:PREDICTED: uncharacterized protein LOC107073390 [Polistes dominula]
MSVESSSAAESSNLGMVSRLSGETFVLEQMRETWAPVDGELTTRYTTAAIANCDASEKPCSSTAELESVLNQRWTLMGKIPKRDSVDTATMITTMFVKEANLSDMWSLDIIGIKDPIEKLDKFVKDEKTRDFLLKTARLNTNGRYEVKLPWVEDHTPVASNFDIAQKRLTNFFQASLDEKIIEKVSASETNKPSHYLPHRPVVKEHNNCVASVDCFDELETFIQESTAVILAAGFELRGWESTGDSAVSQSTLVLGIQWNKKRDTLSVNPAVLDMEAQNSTTKRITLSATHKIFDPIGITCPVSLQTKLILQKAFKIWLKKIDWDVEIVRQAREEFLSWKNDLISLKNLEIPRGIGKGYLTLHVFGDAGGSAYAAAVFARVELDGRVSVSLLNAKARLDPKRCTIPRLELMAATIAVRLANSVRESLTRAVLKTYYWTDSTTVLAWIGRVMQWGNFVWNRVNEIRKFSKIEDWKYIQSDQNPADLPSRGCSSSQLLESKWWLGPDWLYNTESYWPTSRANINEDEVCTECKKSCLTHMVSLEDASFEATEYFSSCTRRILLQNKKFLKDGCEPEKISYTDKGERKNLRLSFKEIRNAETKVLKYLHANMFSNEKGKEKLSSFSTFLNKDDLIVVKTKIFNRKDSELFRCPILLDSNNEIVKMLIRESHERLGHVGALVIMSNLSERFWIISLRKEIRKMISKCVTCNKPKSKRMACDTPALPENRVRDAAIFEVVGVDFAGPLFLRDCGKAWICIFTCVIYRAVHLELTTSLAATGVLEVLRRFIA